jgi:hypothetical protein
MARSRTPTNEHSASGHYEAVGKAARPAARRQPVVSARKGAPETAAATPAPVTVAAPLSPPAAPAPPAPTPREPSFPPPPPPPDPAPATLGGQPSPESSDFVASPTAIPEVVIDVTLIQGGLTKVKAPIAIGARYEGLGFAGGTKGFDRILDSWLSRAVDLGMIGSGLGQLFPINLQRMHEAGKVQVGYLLLVGMGEPGRFAADDLRFMISNVTVAVKTMGHDQLATSLFGTRRNELPVGDAVRGFVMGIVDGYERFRAITDVAQDRQERLQQAAANPLSVLLIESDEGRLTQIKEAFEALIKEALIPRLRLTASRGARIDDDPVSEPSATDTEPEVPVTLLRVTQKDVPVAGAPAASGRMGGTELFEFSALSETAAVSVREQEVGAYLLAALSTRMAAEAIPLGSRERLGKFFADLVIPEDFRKTTESAVNLTLEVDQTTATYPWEMMAQKKNFRTSFLGTSVGVSRQFRSLMSPRPSSPPPLNTGLNVLVIADPAPGSLSLPFARQEGFSVIEVLDQARRAWQGQYEIHATVRIGSRADKDELLKPRLEELGRQRDWIVSADWCDPLDIAMLIVSEQYDVIHFAGHGFVDQKADRAGWVLDKGGYLSAQEIFRVRQVPRLVFANACFSAWAADGSSEKLERGEQRKHLVSVARAFFARGIPNFIGAGWEVDDECARECARWFYARVLGLSRPDPDSEIIGTSPPATISAALLHARLSVFQKRPESSTWGAYQHYGRVSDKLLPLPNVRAASRAGDGPAGNAASSATPTAGAATNPTPPISGATQMPTTTTDAGAASAAINPNLVYVNGIDLETGKYAVAPRLIEELSGGATSFRKSARALVGRAVGFTEL